VLSGRRARLGRRPGSGLAAPRPSEVPTPSTACETTSAFLPDWRPGPEPPSALLAWNSTGRVPGRPALRVHTLATLVCTTMQRAGGSSGVKRGSNYSDSDLAASMAALNSDGSMHTKLPSRGATVTRRRDRNVVRGARMAQSHAVMSKTKLFPPGHAGFRSLSVPQLALWQPARVNQVGTRAPCGPAPQASCTPSLQHP
jgi:hypothetical protein